MAAHPIAVVHDGIVEIPKDLRDDPRFRNGASLQLVPVAAADATETAKVAGDWRRLQGILADSDFDPNAELEEEKQRELESEARWLHR